MVFGIIQVQLFAISIFCFCAVFSHVNLQLKRQFAEVFAPLTFIGLFSSVFEVVFVFVFLTSARPIYSVIRIYSLNWHMCLVTRGS